MIRIDHDKCDACGTCIGVCSPDAISMEFENIIIDHDTCINCMSCVAVCPAGALSETE